MPEAEKIQDDRLVDIDTSGAPVDVELEETKVNPVEETVEEVAETPVVEETTTEAKTETPETPEKTEHDKYSEKVNTRISKLVGKLREAERREEAAIKYANGLQNKQKELEANLSSMNQNYVSSMETASTSQVEEAKLRLKKAIEEGDVNAQTDAQSILARATLDAERAKMQKEALEAQAQRFAQQQEIPQTPVYQQPTPQAPPPDPKANAWAEKNVWFGQDEAMTYTAFAVHRKLVEEQGYDPKSDEYYEEIDRQIREQFPNKFEAEKSKKTVDQTVAPAVKSTSKQGKRTVRLTPSQVAIAKKLGVPLEEYAKYVKE
jgi:hypothetical protein